jgi:NAD(P)-dependent dehydrogenase (short-subunit alcohol dehydrogenase family)
MGAAHARAVVAHGGSVMIADLQDEAGGQLAKSLGPAAAFVHLDVTDEDSWKDAVAFTLATFGKLTGLVNNAGIVQRARLESYSRADWDGILAVKSDRAVARHHRPSSTLRPARDFRVQPRCTAIPRRSGPCAA